MGIQFGIKLLFSGIIMVAAGTTARMMGGPGSE
jgi:hypothetical protein